MWEMYGVTLVEQSSDCVDYEVHDVLEWKE